MCNKFCFNVAVGEDLGKRPTQEDFVFANFPKTGQSGLAVLSDGMGGHHDSVMAAKFLVTGVAGELSMDLDAFPEMEAALPDRLEALTRFANLQLGSFIRQRGITQTMGATLLTVAISGDKLFWASVGDSLLYVIRQGEIHRLNADHSMAPQIDFMVDAGMISPEKAVNHPDRNILTSAIYGKSITKIDCPSKPFQLQSGDVVLLASDGIETLGTAELAAILDKDSTICSTTLAHEVLDAIEAAGHDDQDNTALVVIKVLPEAAIGKRLGPRSAVRPATPWSLELASSSDTDGKPQDADPA